MLLLSLLDGQRIMQPLASMWSPPTCSVKHAQQMNGQVHITFSHLSLSHFSLLSIFFYIYNYISTYISLSLFLSLSLSPSSLYRMWTSTHKRLRKHLSEKWNNKERNIKKKKHTSICCIHIARLVILSHE